MMSVCFKITQTATECKVMSEKKRTFICEIVMERYLRNTQKQLKIRNYLPKSFLDFYLIYNGVCLKILGSLLL